MRRTRSASSRRALAAVILGMVMLTGSAACSIFADSPEEQEASDVIATEVQDALGQRSDLVTVKVVYQNNLNVPATAYVTGTVTPGAAFEPVVDEITERIWQSRLYPLSSIGISLTDAQDPHRNTGVELVPDGKDRAELERKYGPRPPR